MATAKETLESLLNSGTRIRIHYGDKETGKAWLEEFEIMGKVGRSTGREPVLLLVHNKRSMGGGAIMLDSVMRIQETATGRELFRHDKYTPPKLINAQGNHKGLENEVLRGGVCQARFKKRVQADRYIAFMLGERMTK